MAPKRAAATKKVASPAPATRRSTRQTAPSAKVAAGEKAVSSGKAVKKSVAKGAKTAATKSISPERVERKLPAKAPKTAVREKTAPATESSPPKRGRPAKKGASPNKISPVKGGSPAKKAALTEEDEHHDAPPQKEKPCAVEIGNGGSKILDSEPYPYELPRDKATEIVEDLIARFRDPMKSKNAAEDLLLHAAYYVLRSALFGGGQYCKAAKAPTEELRKVFEEALSKERFGHGNTLVEILTRGRETQNYFDPESSLEYLQNGVPRRLMSWEKTTLDDMRPIEEELKARHDGKSGPPSLKQLKTFFDRLKAARYGMARSAEVDVKRQVALWNEVTGEDFDGVFAGGRKAELASWKRLEKTLAEWPAEGVKPSIEGRDRKADKGKAVTGMARSKRPAKAVSTSPAKSHPRSPTRSASKSPAASKSPRRSAFPVKSTSKTSVGVGRNLWDPDQGFEELHPPETRGAEPNNTILGNQRTATRSQPNASVTRSNGLARRSPCNSPAPARRASRSPVRGRSQSPAATAGPSKAVKPPRTASSIQRALRRIGTAEEQRMREGYQDRLVRLPPSRKSSSGRAKSAGDDAAAPPSNKRKRTPSPDETTRSKSPANAGLRPSAHSDSSQGSPSPRKKKSRKATVRDVEKEQVYDLVNSQLVPVDSNEMSTPPPAKKPQSPRKHGIKGGSKPAKRPKTSSFGEDSSERGNKEALVNRPEMYGINGKAPEMDKPSFEPMPAPEVWLSRMPNGFPFGETLSLEKNVSSQIIEDLARSNNQDTPQKSEGQKENSPARRTAMIDRVADSISAGASAVGRFIGLGLSPSRTSTMPAAESAVQV